MNSRSTAWRCAPPAPRVAAASARRDFFAGRAIRSRGALPANWPYPQRHAKVGRKIVSAIGRVDYCRVRLRDGRVEPLALSGASVLSSTTRADGFVVVPADSEGHAPDSDVTVYLYDPI